MGKRRINPKSLANLTKHQFSKGTSGNPKGRKPNTLGSVNAALKREGYKIATRSQITDAYILISSLPKEKVISLGSDEHAPMLVRILCKEILGNKGFDVIERIMDRVLGRPQQYIDHTTKNKPLQEGQSLANLTDEELDAEIAKYESMLASKKAKKA